MSSISRFNCILKFFLTIISYFFKFKLEKQMSLSRIFQNFDEGWKDVNPTIEKLIVILERIFKKAENKDSISNKEYIEAYT